jgi:hypothetical protein
MKSDEFPIELDDAEAIQVERQRHQLHERHWTMLVISLLVIILSVTLRLNPSGTVGAAWLPISSLPPLCGSRALLGVECPGCGLTRSFVALGNGDWRESLRMHRVGWLLAAAVVLQIPYRAYSLWELRRRLPQRSWPNWFGRLLIAALLVNWFAKALMS